jgi:beta-ketoacyl-acyl-carrier-protein synthase II
MARPDAPGPRRVVVTGLGAVTPFGLGVDALWAGLLAGVSAVGPVTRFAADGMRTRIAAEVPELPLPEGIDARDAKRMDRFTLLALTAAQEAWGEAGLSADALDPYAAGAVIGSSHGGEETVVAGVRTLMSEGPVRLSPWLISRMLGNMAAAQVAIHYGLHGPSFAVASACATGAHAIGEAAEIIRRGDVQVMLAGASDACITSLTLAGDAASGALSARNDDPARASRPFDAERDGFVVGEGAGVLVLERLDHALARGARPLAELAGYGTTADAVHATAPAEDGEGMVRAILLALEDARLAPQDIDYVNAHGTGTPLNDGVETLVLKRVLGERAYDVPVSSIKSMLGHLLGAGGAVEAVTCVRALLTGRVPPTINLVNPDPACDLDYVPEGARRLADLEVVLSNALGFGGHNCALLFRAI